MSDPVRQLKTYGRDVAGIPLPRIPSSFNKVAFLCINTYTSFRLALGAGPLNDALHLAKVLKNSGFEIYFLHNPHVRNFLVYLDLFFRNTTGQLVLYYVGRGMTLRTPDSTSSDPRDKALVFDDGTVADDDLCDHLLENRNPSCEVVLITDACFEGTIWDIRDGCVKGRRLPPGIVSLSACVDFNVSKAHQVEKLEQGMVTYNLAKVLKAEPELTPNEICEKMRVILRPYAQTFTVATTTPTLLIEPLFPWPGFA
jgi:hypothetical protein